MSDYSLSPAFDIRGINNLSTNTVFTNYSLYDEFNNRSYIEIDESNYLIDRDTLENVKGVIRIQENLNPIATNSVTPIGLNISIESDVLNELKRYCRGFFL